MYNVQLWTREQGSMYQEFWRDKGVIYKELHSWAEPGEDRKVVSMRKDYSSTGSSAVLQEGEVYM